MKHLFVVAGLIPHPITQALWKWHKKGVDFDGISILTTSDGLRSFLSPNKRNAQPFLGDAGALANYFRDFSIPNLVPDIFVMTTNSSKPYIQAYVDSTESVLGAPNLLRDVKTESELELAAFSIVKCFNKVQRERAGSIYCLYSGGRRAMAGYLMSAVSIFGHPNKAKLFYVSNSPEIQLGPDYYYPSILDSENVTFNSSIQVNRIPIPMLGERLGEALESVPDYRTLIPTAQEYINNLTKPVDRKHRDDSPPEIVSCDQKYLDAQSMVGKYAKMGVSPVLVYGESGTGKELAAANYYYHSSLIKEESGPFIKVNLTGIPSSLQESLLFGHVKGAFTGADHETEGILKQAENGTLFLDELNSASVELQAMLLRFLETGEIQKIGMLGNAKRIDVKIILAVNEPIDQLIRAQRMRPDFLFRMKGKVTLPPLRSRREDISLLIEYFVKKYCKQYGKTDLSLSPDLSQAFCNNEWPGNVRQLMSAIENLVMMHEGEDKVIPLAAFTEDDFISSCYKDVTVATLEGAIQRVLSGKVWGGTGSSLDFITDTFYATLFEQSRGNGAEAVRISGVGSSTIHDRWKKLKPT